MGMIRYILIGLAIYLIMKTLKKIGSAIAGSQEPTKNVGSTDDVIEICPKCGIQKNPGHKCKK